MNLRQIRYFVKAVDSANLSEAARQLNLSQPSLGYQLRQLEAELGTELLSRHSRGVKPTPAGCVVYKRAMRILAELSELSFEIKSLKCDISKRRLKVGLTPNVMRLIGAELSLLAASELPHCVLSLRQGSSTYLGDLVASGQIDVAFAYQAEHNPKIDALPVLDEELMFTSLPGTGDDTSGRGITMAEALAQDLLMSADFGVVRKIVSAEAERRALTFQVAAEVSSMFAIIDLIKRGRGCTIMPPSLAARELGDGSLRVRRVRDAALQRTLYLMRAVSDESMLTDGKLDDFFRRIPALMAERMCAFAKVRPLWRHDNAVGAVAV